MVWPDLDQELLIWQTYLDISAAPERWYATTFFSCHSLQRYAWEVLPFGCNFKMFEIAKNEGRDN